MCKLCAAAFDKREQLLEHYCLHLYEDCICTFQSVNALKIHLTRLRSQTVVTSENQVGCVSFICPVWIQATINKTLLSHLTTHLKHEMVHCPFKNCHYCTNVYSSFNAHKVGIIQTVMPQMLRMRLA